MARSAAGVGHRPGHRDEPPAIAPGPQRQLQGPIRRVHPHLTVYEPLSYCSSPRVRASPGCGLHGEAGLGRPGTSGRRREPAEPVGTGGLAPRRAGGEPGEQAAASTTAAAATPRRHRMTIFVGVSADLANALQDAILGCHTALIGVADVAVGVGALKPCRLNRPDRSAVVAVLCGQQAIGDQGLHRVGGPIEEKAEFLAFRGGEVV